jgi:hypothetical protein
MVKTKLVFNTLGRDEMLADARTGRNRRDAFVGIFQRRTRCGSSLSYFNALFRRIQ